MVFVMMELKDWKWVVPKCILAQRFFFLVSILVLPHQSSHDMKVVIDLGRESSHNTIHILYWLFHWTRYQKGTNLAKLSESRTMMTNHSSLKTLKYLMFWLKYLIIFNYKAYITRYRTSEVPKEPFKVKLRILSPWIIVFSLSFFMWEVPICI